MPKTETPKTPEQNEKPQKPSPETRVKKNENAADKLRKRLENANKKNNELAVNWDQKLKDTREKIVTRGVEKLERKEAKIAERVQRKSYLKTDKAYGGLADHSDEEMQAARDARNRADEVRKEKQGRK